MNTRDIQQALAKPFHQDEVNWRVGAKSKDDKKGMALAYVDARAVMNRLDVVMGIDGWQDEYQVIDGRTICRLGIRIDAEWIWKSDGAGDSAVEGEKGGISDAFKRAGVKWGIGRYLYDLDSPWVELDEHKRMKTRPQLPPWALPENHQASFRAIQSTNGHQATQAIQPPTLAQKAEYTNLVLWAHEIGKIDADQRVDLLAWLTSPQASQGEAQRRIDRWKMSKTEAQPA